MNNQKMIEAATRLDNYVAEPAEAATIVQAAKDFMALNPPACEFTKLAAEAAIEEPTDSGGDEMNQAYEGFVNTVTFPRYVVDHPNATASWLDIDNMAEAAKPYGNAMLICEEPRLQVPRYDEQSRTWGYDTYRIIGYDMKRGVPVLLIAPVE